LINVGDESTPCHLGGGGDIIEESEGGLHLRFLRSTALARLRRLISASLSAVRSTPRGACPSTGPSVRIQRTCIRQAWRQQAACGGVNRAVTFEPFEAWSASRVASTTEPPSGPASARAPTAPDCAAGGACITHERATLCRRLLGSSICAGGAPVRVVVQ